MSTLLDCPKCHKKVEAYPEESKYHSGCPRCRKSFSLILFPACTIATSPVAATQPDLSSESCCFYHPTTSAVRICDGCGAFLCDLCDLDLGKEHLCPHCLDSGQRQGKLENLKGESLLYDGIALGLALIPLTLFLAFAGFLTAPAAIYLSIAKWKTPGGQFPRNRWRFVVALVLAVLQILVFFLFCYAAYWGSQHKSHAK